MATYHPLNRRLRGSTDKELEKDLVLTREVYQYLLGFIQPVNWKTVSQWPNRALRTPVLVDERERVHDGEKPNSWAVLSFGRIPRADGRAITHVIINDPRISKLHCEIRVTGYGFILVDLSKHNTTGPVKTRGAGFADFVPGRPRLVLIGPGFNNTIGLGLPSSSKSLGTSDYLYTYKLSFRNWIHSLLDERMWSHGFLCNLQLGSNSGCLRADLRLLNTGRRPNTPTLSLRLRRLTGLLKTLIMSARRFECWETYMDIDTAELVIKHVHKQTKSAKETQEAFLQRKEQEREFVDQEVTFMMKYRGTDILACFEKGKDESEHMSFYTEYFQGNLDDLFEHLETIRGLNSSIPFDIDVYWGVIQDTLCALWKLHERGEVHGDIKPANIFYRQPHNSDVRSATRRTFVSKLGYLGDGVPREMNWHKATSTQYFGAPEYWSGMETRQSSAKADVWSVGVLMAIFINPRVHGKRLRQWLRGKIEMQSWRRYIQIAMSRSKYLSSFAATIAEDPADRPTVETLMLQMKQQEDDGVDWRMMHARDSGRDPPGKIEYRAITDRFYVNNSEDDY